ncbi:MAG: APC family permease [Planctomycetales bacterium]
MPARDGNLPHSQTPPPDAPPGPATLPRVLGLFSATTMVIGGIIGSGIFFKATTLAKGDLGSFGPIIGVWVLVGLHMLCGSLALAELAAMLPQAGGPYVYLRDAYGKLVAFLWGWSEFWIVRTASLGALACATVISLNEVVPLGRTMQQALAIAIILGLTAINVIGTRWGASVQNVTAVMKVAFLAALIILPAALGRTDAENLQPLWPETLGGTFWRALGIAMIDVLWPYDGWINIAPMAEEIQRPQRNIPLALAIGSLTVISIYVLANVSYHLSLSLSSIAHCENGVAAETFRALFGETGAKLAALGVMCSTFGATNSNLLTGPRIYFAMARDRLLPSALCKVHATYQTPSNSVIIQAIWSVALILAAFAWKSGPLDKPIDAFDALTDFVIFGGLLFYALVVSSVIVLRYKNPNAPRPYRTWGYPVTPVLYLVGSAGVMVSMLLDKWAQTAAGTILILAGVVFYYWMRKHLEDPQSGQADVA